MAFHARMAAHIHSLFLLKRALPSPCLQLYAEHISLWLQVQCGEALSKLRWMCDMLVCGYGVVTTRNDYCNQVIWNEAITSRDDGCI